MNEIIHPAPVRSVVTVKAAPDKAFDTFTRGIGRWWPKTHSIVGVPQRDVVLGPAAGGRWFEIGEDGSTCDWGRVLAYEPPHRRLLAWQVNAEWKFDPGFVTELELRFVALAGGGTRVELEHRNLERFGDAAGTMREKFDAPGGWQGILELFAAEADG